MTASSRPPWAERRTRPHGRSRSSNSWAASPSTAARRTRDQVGARGGHRAGTATAPCSSPPRSPSLRRTTASTRASSCARRRAWARATARTSARARRTTSAWCASASTSTCSRRTSSTRTRSTSSSPGPGASPPGRPAQGGQWHCVETFFNGAQHELRVWIDESEMTRPPCDELERQPVQVVAAVRQGVVRLRDLPRRAGGPLVRRPHHRHAADRLRRVARCRNHDAIRDSPLAVGSLTPRMLASRNFHSHDSTRDAWGGSRTRGVLVEAQQEVQTGAGGSWSGDAGVQACAAGGGQPQ